MQREFEKNPKVSVSVSYKVIDDDIATDQQELITLSTLSDLLHRLKTPRKGIIKSVTLID